MAKANAERDHKIVELYLEGRGRKEVMEQYGISTNTMAGISTRLNLHWSWPLENRRSGVAPPGYRRKPVRTTPFRAGATKLPMSSFQGVRAPETIPTARRSAPNTLLSSREKRMRGFLGSETEFGGPMSPFPIPSEVSGNPDHLTRAEIHALATLYKEKKG